VFGSEFSHNQGGTAIASFFDEIAFVRNENSWNPETEILNAVRPMGLTTGAPLICFSSPYGRRGEAWEAYRRHYGPQGDRLILVAQAASRVMKPGAQRKGDCARVRAGPG